MIVNIKFWVFFLILFFGMSIFISFLINWLFLRLSFNLGTKNSTTVQQVRWSSNIKPSVGGISFFIVFLISIAFIGALPRESEFFFDKHLIGITIASTLGFLIGLADDAYNTNPLVKFIGQLSCAFILIICDVYIHFTELPALDFAITTFWIIGLMNSINMLDNMDGVTASISATIIVGFIVIIFANGSINQNFYLVMMLGVLGSLLGFLYFNWSPSSIYMGDTGSQFLGVFLGACGILYFWKFKEPTLEHFQIQQFVIPILFFIVPIIDTTTVTIRRLIRKQSPFVGGKDHITHHLAYIGFSEQKVVLILVFTSLSSIPLSFPLLFNSIIWSWQITALYFAYFVLLFLGFQWLYNIGKNKKTEKDKGIQSLNVY